MIAKYYPAIILTILPLSALSAPLNLACTFPEEEKQAPIDYDARLKAVEELSLEDIALQPAPEPSDIVIDPYPAAADIPIEHGPMLIYVDEDARKVSVTQTFYLDPPFTVDFQTEGVFSADAITFQYSDQFTIEPTTLQVNRHTLELYSVQTKKADSEAGVTTQELVKVADCKSW